MIKVVSAILSHCADIIGVIFLLLQLAWNLYVVYLILKFTVFIFSNIVLCLILVIIWPTFLYTVYGFLTNAIITVRARERH